MGNSKSKEELALQQCKKFRQNFYAKMASKLKANQDEINLINQQLKKRIVSMSAIQIANTLDQKTVTARQVVLIFMERCCTIGVQKRYFIDQMFDDALIQADQIDKKRKQNPQKKCWRYGLKRQQCFPPFFGVPCCLKQSILLKGRQSYGGFLTTINPIPKQNSAYVQLLYNMGLIPLVRSNVPQSCLTICTNNNIFGYSQNFHKEGRSVGGSSGGDGGAVGARCVPIGIGSDIGGSLRIPAEFNGLYTIKPSRRNDRQANMMYSNYLGGTPVFGQLGPLVHSSEDLKYFCDYVFRQQNYKHINPIKIDPHLRLTDFNTKIFQDKPKQKICIVKQTRDLKCSKSHERVLETVKSILQKEGHQVQYNQLANLDVLYYFFLRFLFANKGIGMFNQIKGNQPLVKEYYVLYRLSNLSWLSRAIIIKLLIKKQPRIARLIKQLTPLTRQQYAEDILKSQLKVGKQMLTYFHSNKYDAILMPGFALPATKLGSMANLQCCYLFNTCWNVLHYPAGSMPISWVKKQETTFNDNHQDFVTKAMRDNIEGSQGLPVGIQVICLPKQEERIIYIMQQIQKGLVKNNQQFMY